MVWSLPPELDDIILDHLHDDPSSLAHCALVCHSWLPAVRYHFWHHLRLNCAADELNRLREFLTSSPEVGFYIRDVVVMQKKGEVCQWYDLNLLHLTLSVLSQLPNLTNLTLDGLWFGAPTRGEKVPASVLSLSVRELSISTCSFDTFEDVQQLCRAFPALSRLHFDGVWWGRWANSALSRTAKGEHTTPALALRELDLGSCFSRDKVIEWLLYAAPANSIETLRLPLIGANDTRLKDLLASVGESLQHLEIGSPSTSHGRAKQTSTDSDHSIDAYLDITSNTSLQSITLGVPTYRDPDFITTWLLGILSQVSSSMIEEIRFAIYPILRGDAKDAESMLASFGWSELAKSLDKPQLASIKKISFSSGRSTDYMQIPGAFVHLTPLLQNVIPRFFDADSMRRKGIDLSFQCI